MKLIPDTDFWVPDCDEHFSRRKKKTNYRPFIENYQRDVYDAAKPHIKNWKVALDIGACVSTFTRYFCEDFEKVYAFEPAKDTYECLIKNIKPEIQHKVIALNVAVGEKNKLVGIDNNLRLNERDDKSIGQRQIDLSGKDIKMITIDSLELTNIGIMKLDVQSYEFHAIMGASQTIKHNKPVIICEVEGEDKCPKKFGHAPGHVISLLKKWGMKVVGEIRKDFILAFPFA